MAIKPTTQPREIIPAGNHVARLYRIMHIGTIPGEWEGQAKEIDTILLGFELPNETREFKEGDGQKPMVISQEYTLSMGKKSNLRKVVEGMIGASLSSGEAEDFDATVLMGTPVMLNILHKTSAKGNEYAVVAGAAPMPKGIDAPAPVNEPFILDFDENWSQEKFDKQPEFLRDKITSSRQYQRKFFGDQEAFTGHEFDEPKDKQVDESGIEYPPAEINPDDIPF